MFIPNASRTSLSGKKENATLINKIMLLNCAVAASIQNKYLQKYCFVHREVYLRILLYLLQLFLSLPDPY